MKVEVDGFDFDKFAVYVHENNIELIVEALEKAMYHIERNGNSKIILTDMALELTRYIHKKPTGIK
jgi:DNA polymerase-3 subunit delta'